MKTLTISVSDQLESDVRERAESSGIDPAIWAKFMARLSSLRTHNERMYQHSLRVGLYASSLAQMERLADIKLPLYGGCGHDIGKCSVPNSILNAKTLAVDSPEFTIIRTHTRTGFELLKSDFPFTALVAGLHHSYQERAYGIDLEMSPVPLTESAKKALDQAARLVAICDFYDAMTTRNNDRGLINNARDAQELHNVMLKFFPNSATRIVWLLAQGNWLFTSSANST